MFAIATRNEQCIQNAIKNSLCVTCFFSQKSAFDQILSTETQNTRTNSMGKHCGYYMYKKKEVRRKYRRNSIGIFYALYLYSNVQTVFF